MKLDEIQHPFLVLLERWARELHRYSFGSEFGKSRLYAASPSEFEAASDASEASIDPENVSRIYLDGFTRFGADFDASILADFEAVGYPCESIDISPFEQPTEIVPGRIVTVLSVREVGLNFRTEQHEMSMGMYRALALLINLHHKLRSNSGGTILVDDIGEGLDFERASSLIKIVVDRCRDAQIQLVMSTNDRFVMNAVDLKSWHVLHRVGSTVRVENYETQPSAFDKFSFLGLSNFDFFVSETSGIVAE